ncbi:MAG: GvpL/GvpF family gas vesicle protein [Chloroflexi bacterium]|nr:GvpL/GvpF family gas vesicle protein [Chloroflexota bacterium]
MNHPEEDTTSNGSRGKASVGLYLYCIGDSPARADLGRIGLGGGAVYTIPYRDICAVVHRCPGQPYKSEDRAVVTSWVESHWRVVESARSLCGVVLPWAFNMIFQGRDYSVARRALTRWLALHYDRLRVEMDKG